MELKNISAAMVKAQRAFGPALKANTNPAFKSKYADLGACIEAVIDALHANGIALLQKQHPHDGGVSVETVFVHESGEQLSAGVLSVPASKQDPQGYGSALTYARRYSLMAACGIAPEDDDGNAASKPRAVGNAQPTKAANSAASDPHTLALTTANMVTNGEAPAAAKTMSVWPEAKLNAVWALLPAPTQDILTKAWPKAA